MQNTKAVGCIVWGINDFFEVNLVLLLMVYVVLSWWLVGLGDVYVDIEILEFIGDNV